MALVQLCRKRRWALIRTLAMTIRSRELLTTTLQRTLENRVTAERRTAPGTVPCTTEHAHNRFFRLCARAVALVAYRVPYRDRFSALL